MDCNAILHRLWRFAFVVLVSPGFILSCKAQDPCGTGDISCSLIGASPFLRLDRTFAYVSVGTTATIYRFYPDSGVIGATGTVPSAVISARDPNNKFMIGVVQAVPPNNVYTYMINSYTGNLVSGAPNGSANNGPAYVDFHPSGRYLYTSNYSSLDISAFSIDPSSGALTKLGDFATSCGCANLAQIKVSPDGKYIYTTSNGGSNFISGFSINQSTGVPTFVSTTVAAAGMDAILVDPTSSYVYGVSNAGTISGYSINTSTGVLTALSGSPFATTAGSLRGAMHPSGRFLYTVNVAGGQLAKHDIATNGALGTATTISFGTNLQYVAIDPSGKFGFVNDGIASSFYIFAINQNTGAANLIPGNPIATSGPPGLPIITRPNAWL